MGKGGRYLNTNKKEKKKGKGLKIFVIVLLILALLIGGGVFAFRKFMGSMLGNVNRAEFEEKNQDKSYDDLMAEIYGGVVQEPAEEDGTDEDVYVPSDVQVPQETETAVPETTVSAA
ncbi:MAG: hypothetical protein Q4B26_20245 [Eubacteriales bacterium]|nr:hypothetical protein [Eubacteriales bacterium]